MREPDFIIAVDFDQTICNSNFPETGPPIQDSINIINQWYSDGLGVIINTCRTGKALETAEKWLKDHDVKYDLINENYPHLIEFYGTDTRKMSANIYVDDKNLGGLPPWFVIDVKVRAAHFKFLKQKNGSS